MIYCLALDNHFCACSLNSTVSDLSAPFADRDGPMA